MAQPISIRSGKPSNAGSPSIVRDYDRRQLEQEWRQHGLTSQLSEVPHVNLKQRFGEVRQLPRPVGLNAALQLAGMSFQGQQHRALEDARNTARLLPLVLPVEH